jgi:NCAIR mutase (PurE)-related protein
MRADPDSVIVIAGMEGALPSVICARVRHPVIAVPTSVGYGTHYKGIAPLLAMMNTCVPGITVVNIDNGFGAAAAALRISATRGLRRTRKDR